MAGFAIVELTGGSCLLLPVVHALPALGKEGEGRGVLGLGYPHSRQVMMPPPLLGFTPSNGGSGDMSVLLVYCSLHRLNWAVHVALSFCCRKLVLVSLLKQEQDC
jgi:hypothetical protein